MKSEVLTKFEHPWLMVVGMLFFIGLFGYLFFRTISKNRNQDYQEASQLPLEEAGESNE